MHCAARHTHNFPRTPFPSCPFDSAAFEPRHVRPFLDVAGRVLGMGAQLQLSRFDVAQDDLGNEVAGYDEEYVHAEIPAAQTRDTGVKQHNGHIAVNTEPGVFTEFIITLPRAGVARTQAGGTN